MQRSGSTLQFQLAAHVVEMVGRGQRQTYVEPEKLAEAVDQQPPSPVLKVAKTHVFNDSVRSALRSGRAVGLYTFRDIRDVVVSFMHKERRAFSEESARHHITHNLAWYAGWAAEAGVMVSRYEAIVQDLSAEVARIAAFLDIPLSAADCAEVAAQYNVERQRETIAKSVESNQLTHYTNSQFDPHSLLHTNHIHSGEVGGWRSALTPDQIAFVEGLAGDWLTENGYPLYTS
jgi:hypothetical protein